MQEALFLLGRFGLKSKVSTYLLAAMRDMYTSNLTLMFHTFFQWYCVCVHMCMCMHTHLPYNPVDMQGNAWNKQKSVC